jgi:hypothetical protein
MKKAFVLLAILALALPAVAADRGVAVKPKAAPAAADKERRTALVIGNSTYLVSPLKNPANDAKLMARTLRDLGFSVDERTNLSQNQMKQAIEDFGRAIKAGGVGLFYYAGHGMQVNGQNYLIPVDADIQGEAEVDYKAATLRGQASNAVMLTFPALFTILVSCPASPASNSPAPSTTLSSVAIRNSACSRTLRISKSTSAPSRCTRTAPACDGRFA